MSETYSSLGIKMNAELVYASDEKAVGNWLTEYASEAEENTCAAISPLGALHFSPCEKRSVADGSSDIIKQPICEFGIMKEQLTVNLN